MKKGVLITVFIISALYSGANNAVDSLMNLAATETNDSVLLRLYNQIGSVSNREDEQVSEEYWSKAMDLATEKVNETPTTYFLEQLSTAYNGMGIISKRRGSLSEAITYYQKSIKINEEINNLDKLYTNYYNVGVIYRNLKDYEKALEYYEKSLEYRIEVKDTGTMIQNYLAIGVLYRRMDEYDKALEYYHKSLALAETTDNQKMAAHGYSNIGVIHSFNKNYTEAMTFFNKAFEYTRTQNNQADIAKYHFNMIPVYKGLGNVNKAIQEGELAYQMYTRMNRISNVSSTTNKLSGLYAFKKDYKKAYDYYREHILLRDSVYNEKNTKEVTQKAMQFEFDKKTMADSLAIIEAQKITDLEHKQEISQQRTYMYTGGLILLLVIIFSILVFNRLKISNKQKAIIEKQKMVVEVKNQEITDSINYAKRIQSAILPSIDKMKESLPNSFIFYRPKDIVAGDFYWYKKINNKIFIAVADCTGHGVPGAMVSVVCHNALNRAVNDFRLLDPAKILDKTAELVIEAFKENDDEKVKDGMDISLCSFDMENNKLEYAGAINSMFYITENKLNEIKGDKQPIGHFANLKPFTLHKLSLSKGDKIYMFSDGYSDQFGGVKGKKYMYKRFRDLILGVSNEKFANQQKALENEFDTWKDDLDQVDDVCVIGIEI